MSRGVNVKIGTRSIGEGHPVFICVDLSCNHAGDLAKAHRLVDAAHRAGADAIKLQTFKPLELAELRGGKDTQAEAPWNHYTLGELYTVAQTPWEWHRELFDHANAEGMEAFASTFSPEATAFLVDLGVPALKVAAREYGRSLGIPAGFPTIYSVQPTVAFMGSTGALAPPRDDVAYLHCVSKYPARCEDMGLDKGLRRLPWGVKGLSDHSLCPATPLLAVALGAKIIEVHLMLGDAEYNGKLPLDAAHSWRPEAFKRLVSHIRHAEATL